MNLLEALKEAGESGGKVEHGTASVDNDVLSCGGASINLEMLENWSVKDNWAPCGHEVAMDKLRNGVDVEAFMSGNGWWVRIILRNDGIAICRNTKSPLEIRPDRKWRYRACK